MSLLVEDSKRYCKIGDMPKFAKYFRKAQEAKNPLIRYVYRFLFAKAKKKNLANIVRVKQHPVKIPNARRRIKQIKKDVMAKYPVKKKISFLTVVKMFSDFKLSTF